MEKTTYHWGLPRQVTDIRSEWRRDYNTGTLVVMPRFVLDVPPIAAGFCHRCDQPVMTLRCAWPSEDDSMGYETEHTITVHMTDGTTHPYGDDPLVMVSSLLTRSVCRRCGHHARDQFRVIHHSYHDESVCRTCGDSIHGPDIGD